MSIWS